MKFGVCSVMKIMHTGRAVISSQNPPLNFMSHYCLKLRVLSAHYEHLALSSRLRNILRKIMLSSTINTLIDV